MYILYNDLYFNLIKFFTDFSLFIIYLYFLILFIDNIKQF